MRATTSVLALHRLLRIVKAEGGEMLRFGLVTPYLDDVQNALPETYGDSGLEIRAESHLRKTVNLEFVRVDEAMLDGRWRMWSRS